MAEAGEIMNPWAVRKFAGCRDGGPVSSSAGLGAAVRRPPVRGRLVRLVVLAEFLKSERLENSARRGWQARCRDDCRRRVARQTPQAFSSYRIYLFFYFIDIAQ